MAMQNQEQFEEILAKSFKRMHSSTCAEASLEGLLELWGIDPSQYAWAMAGYSGAIQSGTTTCGLIIGTSCALGFRNKRNLQGGPETNAKERKSAIKEVKRFYKAFLKEFGGTECKQLCGCDFSKPAGVARYISSKAWKTSCDQFFKFVMDYGNKLPPAG